jgi:hypothetical protein
MRGSWPRHGRSIALVSAMVVTGCVSDSPPAPPPVVSLRDGVTRAESLAFKRQPSPARVANAASLTGVTCSLSYLRANEVGACNSPVPAVNPAVPWLYHSGQAVDPGEIEQRLPINIKFPSAVRTVTLSSTGALSCTGTFGRMVAATMCKWCRRTTCLSTRVIAGPTT